MDKRIMDIYDLVALILVLAVCFPLGVTTAVRDYHEVINYEANYKDKTAGSTYLAMKTDYGDYDGKLDKDTAVLTSQIQDYNMMSQSTLVFKNSSGSSYTEKITGTYKDDSDSIAENVYEKIKDDPSTGGYRIKYNAEDDDFILGYESNKENK